MRLEGKNSVWEWRVKPVGTTNTVSLPELESARVKTCLATLLARQEQEINHSFGWITKHTCYAMAHAQLAYYRALEKDGHLRMLRSREDLQHHRNGVETEESRNPLGFILTMEGADPLLTPETIEEFHSLGLRAIG